ncbi:paeninodin family lasso peptide [Paenibacillus sp. FSL K6-3182]
MSKKQWIKPELQVLEVKMTEASPKVGTRLDATFPTGTPVPDLRYS